MNWMRVPPWCFAVHDGASADRARAWVYLLGAWHNGDDPSVREVRRVTGFGGGHADALVRDVWAWAGENGAVRPVSLPSRDPIENGDDSLFELPGLITHAEVVQRARRWLLGHHGCRVAFAEIVTYERVNPDAIGFRRPAGSTRAWSVLVEAKVSRSDFRADRDKIIHRLPDSCPGQERWYLTPPNLVRPEEVPEGWGLAEVGKRTIRVVKPAIVGAFSAERAAADMGILIAAVHRHQIGVEWLDETGKFRPYGSAEAK